MFDKIQMILMMMNEYFKQPHKAIEQEEVYKSGCQRTFNVNDP